MEAKLRYSLADPSGKVRAMGDASAVLGPEELLIAPVSGGPLSYSLREIEGIEEGDYRIVMRLRSRDTLMLFNLGFKHEDLARTLFRNVNELELKDLLMDERLVKQGVPADAVHSSMSGAKQLGRCEVRLYETAIMVMPERAGLLRLRYADVQGTEVVEHHLIVSLEGGERLDLAKLGRELDPLRKGLGEAVADLSAKVQGMIQDAHPLAEMAGVLRASGLMKDGRAAKLDELEAACPGLWPSLERKLAGYGIGEEYEFFKRTSRQGLIRIGMKRPLHAEEAKDYVFFLAPIYSTDGGKGGNAIAFEASSGEDEGRATYFFRIWSRKDYPLPDARMMDEQAGMFISQLVEGLNAINFRREPVYLPEERLYMPEYSRYRFAAMRIPELGLLRERFVGRVVHSSPEQWKEDVSALLAFNVAQKNDSTKWKRVDEGQ